MHPKISPFLLSTLLLGTSCGSSLVASNYPPSGKPAAAPIVQTAPPVPAVPPELIPIAKQAKENLDRGLYSDAEKGYLKILAKDPKNLYALSNLSVTYTRDRKLKNAVLILKRALKIAPRDSFCMTTLGIVYFQMGKHSSAMECFTKAITVDPKNAQAHHFLGIISSQKGWPEAALEELEKAITLNPNYADAHFNIAVICAQNEPPNRTKAIDHYRRAIELGAQPDKELEKLLY